MSTPLRILFVEDCEDDMLLQLRELRRSGYDPVYRCIQSSEELQRALAEGEWDIILSDYSMPRSSGLDALRVVRESGLDLPFILVSGTVGEDTAVECMKAGAADYLLKDSLTRLVPAIRRELREAEQRRRRRRAERDLQQSQALLSLVYDHTCEMLVLFARDDHGTYRSASVNKAWLTFVGGASQLSEDEFLGNTLTKILTQIGVSAEVSAPLTTGLADALRNARPCEFDLEWPTSAGVRHTEQHFIPVGQAGTCHHVLWSCRDITERKQAELEQRRLEARLVQSQKMEALGTLASGIAHEFSNVLVGLSGYAELLQQETRHLPAATDYVHLILQGTHRARELVQRILAFSRKRTVMRRPIHLGPVVYEALAFLRPLLPQNVTVVAQLAVDSPQVLADAGQVHHAVVNLCTNAMHAINGREGTVTVTLDTAEVEADQLPPLSAGRHARLTVRDTGAGMDEATQARLFEPFFTTKPPGMGTGLGLAMVRSMLTAHHGAVTVRSRLGEGTVFALYFPILDESTDQEQTAPARAPTKLVLFVDDEDYLVRMGAAMLERLGYAVAPFTDPELALQAFAANPHAFAILVTDFAMPTMRGTELVLRARRIRPDIPVLLVTGLSTSPDLLRAVEMERLLVLEKPFNVKKFDDALQAALLR